MKKIFSAMFFAASCAAALAGPGHDHGGEIPVPESDALPRVVMEGDLFEAVAVLNGQTFEIFVDHAATNAPVENAELAILLNGQAVPLELHNVGEFDAVLPEAMTGKNVDVALRVTAGDQNEVLTGRLVLDEGQQEHDDHTHSHLLVYTAAALAVVLALVLLAVFFKRHRQGVN